MRIKNIMTNKVIKAHAEMPAYQLLEIIENHGFHHLPVVDDDDHLLGIVSDRDVSKHVSPFIGSESERELDRES